MDILQENLTRFGVLYAIVFSRYLVVSGLAFLIFWKWLRNQFSNRIIQNKAPDSQQMWFEFRNSLVTFVMFALVGIVIFQAKKNGFTTIYKDIPEYGWAYFVFSIFLSIFIHDTYFYWTHRLMHHKKLFKAFHLTHHRSLNPSPWAAFSFQWTEAFVEAGIMLLLVFLIPLHPLAILAFNLYMTVMNAIGHLSIEIFPKGFTKGIITRYHNTVTHHNMHHRYTNYNYSLYFNYWDMIMGTNHPKYHETFEEVKNRA